MGIPKPTLLGHSQVPPEPLESVLTSAGSHLQGSHEGPALGLPVGPSGAPPWDLARCLGAWGDKGAIYSFNKYLLRIYVLSTGVGTVDM